VLPHEARARVATETKMVTFPAMLTKAKVKFIKSLEQKKNRLECGLFSAEGDKVVSDLLQSELLIEELYSTKSWANENEVLLSTAEAEPVICEPNQLQRASLLTSPGGVLALGRIPQRELENFVNLKGLFLYLDRVQDPGNVGTIIRTAEWFGVSAVFLSDGCADAWGPKVVQSAMGSLFRMTDVRWPLSEAVKRLKLPVIATVLDGENIFETDLPAGAIVVIGNESQGVSESVLRFATHRVAIPSSDNANEAGLNAASAAAVMCAEFSRRV